MKKLLLFAFYALFLFTLNAQILHQNNFDDVAVGSKVCASYPDWWHPFIDPPGGNEDPAITDEQSSSAPQSVKLTYGHDLVFNPGDKTSGIYTVDFDMYIPNNVPAYYNVLHKYDIGNGGQDSEWAAGIYINITSNPYGLSTGTYIRVNDVKTNFSVPGDEWFTVHFYFDIDADSALMKINDTQILKWQFSLNENKSGEMMKQLAALDFYPILPTSVFFIDNFVFAKLVPNMNVAPLAVSKVLWKDDEVTVAKETITIANTGDVFGTYIATVDSLESEILWLTIDGDVTGAVAADGTKTFDIVMDATGLEKGIYTGKVRVATNDEENAEFVIDCTLEVRIIGVDEPKVVETKIFPNPASDFVTVKCSEMINSIQIMNNMGQVVRTVSVNSDVTNIDTSNLSAGVYFVKVITDKTAHSNKLIIK